MLTLGSEAEPLHEELAVTPSESAPVDVPMSADILEFAENVKELEEKKRTSQLQEVEFSTMREDKDGKDPTEKDTN